MWLLGYVLGALVLASLPYWLPRAIVAVRIRIFTLINGESGVAIPGPLVSAAQFKRVYAHPAADGRSRGAKLSDLFWYWLAPGPELHQEHLEPGPRYQEVAKATRRILGVSKQAAEALTEETVNRALDSLAIEQARSVRLRDLMLPIWAEFYYAIVFQRACPAEARAHIVAHADDVVSALKCCRLRHMKRRHQLTGYLLEELRTRGTPHTLPEALSQPEQALYLQGTFFNTGVVQMSEAMTHLLLVIAEHPSIQARLRREDDPEYLDHVINEVLRVYPLFGVSHRITSAAIAVDERVTLPAGSVLCFHHSDFHRHGFAEPEQLNPERWQHLSPRDACYIPFGVGGNRPCPAQAIALTSLRVAARIFLRRFRLASSARHDRSIPNAGPCLLVPREAPYSERRQRLALAWMRLADRWQDVARSIVQLLLGTYMIWHARRLRLCERYFAEQSSDARKESWT
ncbi:MAG: cytochrome P450 [Myxococcota bacterium]